MEPMVVALVHSFQKCHLKDLTLAFVVKFKRGLDSKLMEFQKYHQVGYMQVLAKQEHESEVLIPDRLGFQICHQ